MLSSIVRRLAPAALAIIGLQGVAEPVHASPVTLLISGDGDLSSAGGPAVNTFSGVITWDPDAAPFEDDGAGSVFYALVSYSLEINGVDVTLPISDSGNGQGLGVINDVDAFEAGVFVDALVFFGAIGPGASGFDRTLVAALTGPTTMFSSNALPTDLTFLPQTTAMSVWLEGPDDEEEVVDIGTLVASAPDVAVPEPATLALMAIGVGGTLARARRRRPTIVE